MRSLLLNLLLLPTLLMLTPQTQAQNTELPGKRSTWNGFVRTDFEVNERPVTVIIPRQPADGQPWVWHGEFFGHRPIPDVALLGRGFHIVYTRCSDLFGDPTAISHWNQVYQTLTDKHGFGPRPALVGTSRGGLYCYNWAAANPLKVSCIFGDAPVCDIRSWPMGQGTGKRSDAEVRKLQAVYNISDEQMLAEKALSPVDHLQPLASASIPLLHISGDADDIVPIQENTLLLQQRYQALGGTMQVIVKSGVAHVHGLEDSTPIIEFIDKHGR
ncbi:MAG: alpha/beta hydrolase family protein [Planctomycetaceae bacterium]